LYIDKKKTKTIFSGRTDAGVNAKCQVVHFDTDVDLHKTKFLYSINSLLPKDISVKELKKVQSSFHAQKSARWRWYRYVIVNRAFRSVWDIPSMSVHKKIDIDIINKSLEYLKGEHDFSAFRCARSDNPARICNVSYVYASEKNDIISIDIVADRFLYNMVRIIVGTLLKIERNSWSPSKMKEILESKDRTQAGETIIPDGLYLMKVGYENYDFCECKNPEN